MLRKYLFIVIMLLNIGAVLYSQEYEQSNVSTPMGSTVVAYIFEDVSNTQRRAWDDMFEDAYPDAEFYKTYGLFFISSTHRFNCHGYAWYMKSEQGDGLDDPRWIGKDAGNIDEWIYWEDNSYLEVTSEEYPGKVSWNPNMGGDHSAITTGSPGTFISKWAYGPLAKHTWDDCPFSDGWSYNDLKFYKLCGEKIENTIISSNLTKDACGLLIKDVTINNSADVVISFEDWFKIDGTFNTSLGTTLSITP